MGRHTDLIRDYSGYDLESALEGAQETYVDDFKDFWGVEEQEPPDHLEPTRWAEYQKLYRLVQKLASGAKGLVRPRRLAEEKISELQYLESEAERERAAHQELMEEAREVFPSDKLFRLRELLAPSTDDARRKSDFVSHCFEIEAAELFRTPVDRMGDRLYRLFTYVVDDASDDVRDYLARLAECYVRNMPVEFAVMARAVIEAAVKRIVDNQMMREVRERKSDYTLSARLDAARTHGVIDDTAYEAAHRVKDAGDKAVHEVPEVNRDLDELMEDVVTAVSTLVEREQEVT